VFFGKVGWTGWSRGHWPAPGLTAPTPTGKAAACHAGGMAAGAIDAMLRQLDLLRGQVTREIRQAGAAPR
jgi:hypothetical protein